MAQEWMIDLHNLDADISAAGVFLVLLDEVIDVLKYKSMFL